MPRNHEEEELDSPNNLGIFLEVERPGEKPMELPVQVRNFTRDLVTLEVQGCCGGEVGSSLVGRCCNLHLVPAGSDRALDLPAAVTWIRDAEAEEDHLTLGLKLTQSSRITERLLGEYLAPRHRDLQGLWERWEQARAAPVSEEALSPMEHFLAGMGLLVGGLTLQLHGGKALKIFGLAWCLYGGVVIGGTILWHWWRRRRDPR